MSTHRTDSRRAEHLRFALVALVVVVISAAIVYSRELAATETWDDPPRYAGGAPVLALGSVLAPARLPESVAVGVVHDPASDAFHGRAAFLDSLTATWVAALREIGANARVVLPDSLATLRDIDVLVLPSTPCVSVSTFDALAGAARGGRGVLLTRHTGLRDAGCTSLGAGLLVDLTGASRLDTLDARDDAYVTFPAGGPLATDLPPGARLEVRAGNHVALRKAGRDAYWSDYELDPAPASELPLLDAAVVHAERNGARSVYWGFELNDVVDQPWNRSVARLLLRNSIAWAARQPLAEIEPWPGGRQTAAVIAQDVEDEFANARLALDTLRAAGIRGTFFLVTDLATEHRELVEALAEHGEIGTHSENHRLLGGLDAELQSVRLERTQDALRELTGATGAGLRPPEEQFDAATLRAWRATGGSYVFASNDGRTASPELLLDAADPMVLLGRVGYDDFAVLRRAGVTDPDSQATLYLREYERMRALGGLYMFSYHSNMMARPQHVAALGSLARAIDAAADTGLATAGEVAAWWRRRGALRVSVERPDGGALNVVVRNDRAEAVTDAVVRVVLGEAARVANVSTGRLLPAEPGTVRIALPRIEPSSTIRVRVTLDGGGR